jgi:hypothetical protein
LLQFRSVTQLAIIQHSGEGQIASRGHVTASDAGAGFGRRSIEPPLGPDIDNLACLVVGRRQYHVKVTKQIVSLFCLEITLHFSRR